MDSNFISYLVVVFSVAVTAGVIYQRTGKRGEALKAQIELRKKEVDQGIYKTTTKAKLSAFVSGVVVYVVWSYLISVLVQTDFVAFLLIPGLLVGVVFSGLSVAIGETAEKKGRSFNGFWGLSIFISPVIMGIIVMTMAPLPGSAGFVNSAAASVPETKSAADHADQIRKLSSLLESGILTQEEFDTKKKDLLNRI